MLPGAGIDKSVEEVAPPSGGDGRQQRYVQRKVQARLNDEANRRRECEHLRFCRHIWCRTREIGTATPAALIYLDRLGLSGVGGPHLRFHNFGPFTYRWHVTAPALVGRILSAAGNPIGLHVLPLKRDGSGRFTDRVFGSGDGGAVRLAAPQGGRLAVAASLETAASYAAVSGSPTWAVPSLELLRAFQPPTEIAELVVAADGDKWSRRAAYDLTAEVRSRCKASLAFAPDGLTWNEVLNGAPGPAGT